jgi:hypothetical protein
MKTVNKAEKRTPYQLRYPIALMKKYRELAIKNRRSINDEILIAMEQYLVHPQDTYS